MSSIAATLPRTTREIGDWIDAECGITYESPSGLIALAYRLGMEHRKPKAVSPKLDPDTQTAFIQAYNNLLNHMGDDEERPPICVDDGAFLSMPRTVLSCPFYCQGPCCYDGSVIAATVWADRCSLSTVTLVSLGATPRCGFESGSSAAERAARTL
jgi:hypothetical protein